MQNNDFGNQEEIHDPIEEMKDPSFTENETYRVPPEDVVAFTESRSCRDLASMIDNGDLDIQPDFQRNFIWKDVDQTRFIDSLIKRFPIPSMYFAFEYKSDKWSVIDGLQRISIIMRFLEKPGKNSWRLSEAENVDPEIAGKTPDQLETDYAYVSRVKNISLPITVLRCDLSKSDHAEYLVMIFHRLNTGGMRLNNQKIRNCIFGGKLNNLLRNLDGEDAWRRLNRMKSGENNYRLVKQDLMLRFFAFFYKTEDLPYKGRMAPFLDEFMRRNRDCSEEQLREMRRTFMQVVAVFSNIFVGKEPPYSIPANVLYPAMVGIARNLHVVDSLLPAVIRKRFESLRVDSAFKDHSGLATAEVVNGRIGAATAIFGNSNDS